MDNKYVLRGKAIGLVLVAILMMLTMYLPLAVITLISGVCTYFSDGVDYLINSKVVQWVLHPLHAITDRCQDLIDKLNSIKATEEVAKS